MIIKNENDFAQDMRKREEEINDLRKKIEELSNEFARMLKVYSFYQRKPSKKCKKELF